MNDSSPSVNTQQQHSRRDFLKAAAFGAAATGLLPMRVKAQSAPGSGGTEFTLFHQPAKLRHRAERFAAWSNSITVRDGRMVNAVSVQQFGNTPARTGFMGLAIAESDDGVHWRETSSFACPLEHGLAGYYLGMGSRSYMGHLGFSVMMFVSDSATRPFHPDKEAFRLCGNTTRDTNWLTADVKGR